MFPYKRHRPGPVITGLELSLKSNIPSLPSIVHTLSFTSMISFTSYCFRLITVPIEDNWIYKMPMPHRDFQNYMQDLCEEHDLHE
jgi:hypothetical protein